ncbi:MAG: DUF1285 domain-containing protein [Alphaproteobacteria bacterium]|nr:DUF1285 domain-containing protein [Alphaproteobacteria bacterium]
MDRDGTSTKGEDATKACGVARFRIDRAGQWWHDGGLIRREGLVRLFAGILRREGEEHWLVTPVERERVEVEEAAFLVTTLTTTGQGADRRIEVETNVGIRAVVGPNNPLRVETTPGTGEPRPYILIRNGVEARVVRSAFYHLVELAEECQGRLGVWSQGAFFPLGDPTDGDGV